MFFSFLDDWCEDYDDDIQVSHDAYDGDNNRDDDDNHGDWWWLSTRQCLLAEWSDLYNDDHYDHDDGGNLY